MPPTPFGAVALVTGASRGIGSAIALRLAQDGYNIGMFDLAAQESEMIETAKHIREQTGQKMHIMSGDVSSPTSVSGAVSDMVKQFGGLDVSVANAGIQFTRPLLETTAMDFQRVLSVNVLGVHNTMQAAAKQMIKQGHGGRMINTGSIVGLRPFANLGAYSTSKWAVRGLTQVGAMEFAKHKVRRVAVP